LNIATTVIKIRRRINSLALPLSKKSKGKTQKSKVDKKMQRSIKDRSFDFALKIIKIYKELAKDNTGKIIGRQLLRSGTSIGANIEEAFGGCSKKDFINKLTIAQKEARETNYWLRLLKESGLIQEMSIIKESEELLKIISQSIITAKSNKDT
jgi:four helix bundle protein